MAKRAVYSGMMTPRSVRIASLVAVVGLICQHIIVPMVAHGPILINLPAQLIGGLASWILLMWIAIAARGWRGGQPGELDEREVAERNTSFLIAYRLTGFMLMAIYFYGLGVTRYHWWSAPTASTAFALLWSLAWIHVAMPAIILAWRALRESRTFDPEDLEELAE